MSPRGADGGSGPASDATLLRAGGSVAVATLVSRATGFVRTLAIAATLGLALVNSSYTVANTLPTSIYQLLLGGVLTSVVVPVLVRAAREDGDEGEAFAQRLLTMAAVGLAVATVLATAGAPLLVGLYLTDGDPGGTRLAVAFAYLLLPEIFFYGMGAVLGAVLNARGVFGPAAWAPVANNLVVLVALGVYWFLPAAADPAGVSTTQLLVLGIGTTLGIVVQAAAIVPALRRAGFRWRRRWGWDRRLSAFGGLAAWVVGYVVIGQVGLAVTNRVASAADDGAIAIYANAWLLIQVPYGVLGVSLVTVLMPRMSASAADGRTDRVVADLSLGSRLSAVALLPVSAVLTAFGPALGLALFSFGRAGSEDAARLGGTLAVSAFGLLPLAVVMLQMRVFYALSDARTPTFIMVGMTAVKVPLLLACPLVLPDDRVVLGLAAVNALGFVVGALVGAVWLRVRLGHLDSVRVLRTSWRTGLASVAAAAVALLVTAGVDRLLGPVSPSGRAWLDLLLGSALGLVLAVAGMRLLRVTELEAVFARFRR